jgi:FkbM family methyltransferase
MITLLNTRDIGLAAVISGDTHAATWIQKGRHFHHDPTVKERVIPRLNEDWTCIDVGANIGTFTVAMAEQCDRVWAFEPSLPAFVALAVNTRGMHNVTPVYAALGAVRATVQMAIQPNAGATFVATDPSAAVSAHPLLGPVLAVPLDDLGLSPNFIKMDCEGFEPDVIMGAGGTLERCRPLIFCEINRGALARYGQTPDDIIKPLTSMGYKLEFLDPSHSLELEQVDVFFVP